MSSLGTVQALEVSPCPGNPTRPERKRKITPSAAQSSAKRSLLLVSPSARHSIAVDENAQLSTRPFFASKTLFPSGRAQVQSTYELPDTTQQPTTLPPQGPSPSRHVWLPFDLRDKTLDILGDNEIRSLLFNIFPLTTEVGEGRDRSWLHFSVKELPQQPWPLTVGGLPITIGDSNAGRGPLFPTQLLRFGQFSKSICQDLDARTGTFSEDDLRSVTKALYEALQPWAPDVRLVEVMFTSERVFYIMLADGVELPSKTQFPGRVANCAAGYFLQHELNRPGWSESKARRDVLPQPSTGVEDDTAYDTLRPGVMVRSTKYRTHAQAVKLKTTSGVLVRNSNGDRFLTAAAHGIGEDETIFQVRPGNQKRYVGKAVQEISFTDVALVKLHDDVHFVNELFEAEDGTVTRMSRLLGEEDGDDIAFSSMVFINSPFTGSMEGTVVMKSARIEGGPNSHPVQAALRYTMYNWAFLGQVEGADNPNGPHIPPDGTCGSVIVDEDHRAIGFFHYYISEGRWAGFCASVSASEVVAAGYRLA